VDGLNCGNEGRGTGGAVKRRAAGRRGGSNGCIEGSGIEPRPRIGVNGGIEGSGIEPRGDGLNGGIEGSGFGRVRKTSRFAATRHRARRFAAIGRRTSTDLADCARSRRFAAAVQNVEIGAGRDARSTFCTA
jgi:hypothetical protein